MNNIESGYNSTYKWLHWTIGFIAITMLIFGSGLESLPLNERQKLIMGHSGLGTLVLLLMIVRLGWRLTHRPPPLIDSTPKWQVHLSKSVHWTLYALLLAQPIFGILQAMYISDYDIIAFGLINYSEFAQGNARKAQFFHALHGANATIISILVIIHVLAALYHHFFQKDNVLRRMLPGNKSKSL